MFDKIVKYKNGKVVEYRSLDGKRIKWKKECFKLIERIDALEHDNKKLQDENKKLKDMVDYYI